MFRCFDVLRLPFRLPRCNQVIAMTSQILPSKALLADFDKIRLSKNPQCIYSGCSAETIRSHTISKSSIRQLNTDTIQLKTINDNLFDRIKQDDKRNVFNPSFRTP